MGFQDALNCCVPYARRRRRSSSPTARWKRSCYHAYWASTELAAERGRYSSYRGSLWDRGILPLDSLELLEQRGGTCRGRPQHRDGLGRAARPHRRARHAQLQLRGHRADRDHLQHHRRRAHRSSPFGNLSVKSNLSGEFTVVNEYLVRDLKNAVCGTT